MPLGVVDLPQVCVITYGFDPLLKRYHFVVARHHGNGAELEPLGQVHCADGSVAADRLDVLVENLERDAGCLYRSTGPVDLRRCANEDTDFMWCEPGLQEILEPKVTRGSFTMPHSIASISEKSLIVHGKSVPSA